jgi:hypothetical protein
MALFSHLRFLEQRMASITHLPTCFEYYSAIHLSTLYQTCFYVYQDLPHSHKLNAGFPLSDKGIDLVDDTFRHIVQVKYYGLKKKIHYGNLATFLGTPLLVGRSNLRMTLVRTKHCTLHSDLLAIVQRGGMSDVTLCSRAFLKQMR